MRNLASESDTDLAVRAAWLSHVGGYTHEEIAIRLGVSRIKATRLVARAQKEGMVRVFVEGRAADCVALENQIVLRYGLSSCTVVPTVDSAALPLRSLGTAGAHVLYRALERPGLRVVGVGHGRTLAAVVQCLPRQSRTGVKFVSLLGSLTRSAAANPFDVIYRLTERIGGEAYFMPAPFFCDSVEDKQVFLAQKSLRDVFEMALRAEFVIIGIGSVEGVPFVVKSGMITAAEHAALVRDGAVGEILGYFLDSRGRPLTAEINGRAVSVSLDDLRGKDVVAVAGGAGKARALDAVLRSKIITSLVTDEDTAREMIEYVADLKSEVEV